MPRGFFGELFELLVVVVGDEVDAWADGGDGVCEGNDEVDDGPTDVTPPAAPPAPTPFEGTTGG